MNQDDNAMSGKLIGYRREVVLEGTSSRNVVVHVPFNGDVNEMYSLEALRTAVIKHVERYEAVGVAIPTSFRVLLSELIRTNGRDAA